jgi:hypothetical protein
MQAWSLSSLEAPLLEHSPHEAMHPATLTGSSERHDAGAGSRSRRLTSGAHEAAFPSGFVVDDLPSSSASLPQRSSYAAASTADAEAARSTHVDAVHELHNPEGRGSGGASTAPVTTQSQSLLL